MKIYVFLFLLIAVQALPVEKVNDSEKPLETADIVNNQPTEEDKEKNDVDVTTAAAVDEKESTTENVDEEKSMKAEDKKSEESSTENVDGEKSTKTEDKKSSKPYDWCPERSECKKGDLPCILCYGNEAFNVYPCRGFKKLETVEV